MRKYETLSYLFGVQEATGPQGFNYLGSLGANKK